MGTPIGLERHRVGNSVQQEGPVFSFETKDMERVNIPGNLVIQATKANNDVAWVFMYSRSSVNVIFE